MDIIFHLCLLFVIGIFFFIYKYSSNHNPMLFIILFSVLGLFLLWQGDMYIKTGDVGTINYSGGIATGVTFTPEKIDISNYEWVIFLAYLSFLLLSIINLTIREEYNEKK